MGWGNDENGESTPPEGAFTQVSADYDHTCGLKTDGTLLYWGNDEHGESTPPEGTFLQVAAGGYHTCAVRTNHTMTCWGAQVR
jgi:alpha-tubulin suppressor-like RCC1 family protein